MRLPLAEVDARYDLILSGLSRTPGHLPLVNSTPAASNTRRTQPLGNRTASSGHRSPPGTAKRSRDESPGASSPFAVCEDNALCGIPQARGARGTNGDSTDQMLIRASLTLLQERQL